jgi:hypothetical protein
VRLRGAPVSYSTEPQIHVSFAIHSNRPFRSSVDFRTFVGTMSPPSISA